jgi:transcriptional regulator with XRE-family HTH domain
MIARVVAVLRAQAAFLGMSYEDLADRAGCSRSTVARIFAAQPAYTGGAGTAFDFKLGTLLALIDALDLSPGEFFAMVDEGADAFEARRRVDDALTEVRNALYTYDEAKKA